MKSKIKLNEELNDKDICQLTKALTEDTVIVCIGSDRNIGDAIGPCVGSMLKETNFSFPVYGTLEEPIHGLNLNSKIRMIRAKHPEANIIAIDACIPTQKNSEKATVIYSNKPMTPGAGLGKNLSPIGNYSLKVVVSNYYEHYKTEDYLNCLRMSECISFSKKISAMLLQAEERYKLNNLFNLFK